jgi:hypothetical protein
MVRGLSSIGRASAWHAEGQRFDSARLHHFPESEIVRGTISRKIPSDSDGAIARLSSNSRVAERIVRGTISRKIPSDSDGAMARPSSNTHVADRFVRGTISRKIPSDSDGAIARFSTSTSLYFKTKPPRSCRTAGAVFVRHRPITAVRSPAAGHWQCRRQRCRPRCRTRQIADGSRTLAHSDRRRCRRRNTSGHRGR